MTRKELKRKIQSHRYSWTHGEMEHRDRIEKELESENYHYLLLLIRNHNYSAAFDWIEKGI